jgi:ATP-binding cassette, subfamily G (WHITE), member 2, SNQ2
MITYWSHIKVEQMDVHTPLTTVREALLFSATLRAPRGTDVVDVVDRVLDMVDLTPLAGRLVGSPGALHQSSL